MEHEPLCAARVVEPEAALAERHDAVDERARFAPERRLQTGARQDGLARRVEGHEVQGQARGEHPVGGLGVHVHVELRRRRDVAGHVHGAAHRDDAADQAYRAGVRLERQREVGQGPERDERQQPLQPPRVFDDHAHRVGLERRLLGLGPVREVAETVLAVVALGGEEGARERLGGAHGDHGARRRLAQSEQAEDVDRPLLHGNVAGDRGDRLHADLRRAPAHQERERVVDPGIGVDQDGRRHGPSLNQFPAQNLPTSRAHLVE